MCLLLVRRLLLIFKSLVIILECQHIERQYNSSVFSYTYTSDALPELIEVRSFLPPPPPGVPVILYRALYLRYVVMYATRVGGVIVSRDLYRDVAAERPDWKDTIDNR